MGAFASEPGSREPSPTVSALTGFDPSRVMPAIRAIEQGVTDAVMSVIPDGHRCGVIHCTEEQWNTQTDAFGQREAFFAAMMPTEQDALTIMHAAYTRLKELDWNDAIYCPKDGSEFDAIEAGSTGIHKTYYEGEWPNGHWLIAEAGDIWPSLPIMYRRTEAEKQRWAKFGELVASGMSAGTAETRSGSGPQDRQPDPAGETPAISQPDPMPKEEGMAHSATIYGSDRGDGTNAK